MLKIQHIAPSFFLDEPHVKHFDHDYGERVSRSALPRQRTPVHLWVRRSPSVGIHTIAVVTIRLRANAHILLMRLSARGWLYHVQGSLTLPGIDAPVSHVFRDDVRAIWLTSSQPALAQEDSRILVRVQ